MIHPCSKENIKYIICYAETILKHYITNNNKVNGFFVFLFHLFIQISSGYFLLACGVGFSFYATILVWCGILFSNLYFRGCILTKIERHLWDTTDWYGPYFFYCEMFHLTPSIIHNLFVAKIVLISIFICFKLWFR